LPNVEKKKNSELHVVSIPALMMGSMIAPLAKFKRKMMVESNYAQEIATYCALKILELEPP
jgi:hypothetical protein